MQLSHNITELDQVIEIFSNEQFKLDERKVEVINKFSEFVHQV